MPDIRSFLSISVPVPEKRVLKRLGYSSRTADYGSDGAGVLERISRWTSRAADLLEISAVCGIFDIGIAGGTVVFKQTGDRAASRLLAGLLDGCDRALVMGITGGERVQEEIDKLQAAGRLSDAVILHAASGETVDAAFAVLADIYSRELSGEGRMLTGKRLSAGYGDFDISFQKSIFFMLGLEKIGITINEACMLEPEKSVTSVYGILE